jgi:phosphoglycerate dehydrogenase-like enzyme
MRGPMARILMYEPAFRRVEQRLRSADLPIEPLVMSADGVVRLGGLAVAAEAARPDAGWVSSEVFSGPARAFMVALLKSPALRWIQSGAAGVDDPVFARFVAKGARLTTNHAQAISISEHVMAGVLDHFQRGPERRAAQAARHWTALPFREVTGSTWLVFGFGAIGQAVAERSAAFGARVIGVRRRIGSHPLAEQMIGPEALFSVLPEADVVVLCAPLTDATSGVAGEAFFARMKPGSVFVNVGRGGLVNEDSLLRALDRGTPEHAILDVFRQEPLPPESPFWGHLRVSLTPHAAAAGSGRAARGDDIFLENLARFVRAEPLLNAVDPHDLPGAPAAAT